MSSVTFEISPLKIDRGWSRGIVGEGEVARRRGSRKERVALVLVVRKKEDEAGAKAEEAGPLPDRQGLNFSASLYLVSWYIVDRRFYIAGA